MTYLITSYGATADGEVCTEAIQNAINDAAAAGGGRVVVPAGTFRTSSISLLSNVELHVSSGALLQFIFDPKTHPTIVGHWEGRHGEIYASCIDVEGQKNVAITGLGTIDGAGAGWWELVREGSHNLQHPRPTLIGIRACERVTIRDVSLQNSPAWTVHPWNSDDVLVDHIKILNPADSPNTDGINPDSCRNVRIINCHIDVGDDCIAIKAGTEESADLIVCENIVIANCTMVHGHGGVVIGSEMSGGVRNVAISNCIFQGTDRGIRLKSRRGRGGFIKDVRVNNIIMDGVISPFVANLYYFCGDKGKDQYVWDKNPYPIDHRTPAIRRIHLANITARNVHAAAAFIYGLSEQHISEITLKDVSIAMAPDAIPDKPAMMDGIDDMARTGIHVGCVDDLVLSNIRLENVAGDPIIDYGQSELIFDHVKSNGEPVHSLPVAQN